MAVMLLDGKWFDIYGSYYPNGYNNDEQHLHTTFLRNDMFIGDRDFTRCKGKWNLYTPDSICKGETQLPTTKANQTRCITRIRNAIERGFGRLKQCKFIDSVVNTEYIPIIDTIMKILCAVDNAFFCNLVEDSDKAYTNAEVIISNLELENEVMSLEADTIGWRKANTSDISTIIPLYDYNDITKFSSGYSIRVAHAYLGHNEQQWTTYIHYDFSSIIKIKNIVSRKNNEKILPFYTKATALFINFFDCATYKERNKIKHPSSEDDKAINQTKNLTSFDEELIDDESENDDDESTPDTTTDNGSPGATTAVDEFTSDTTIDDETIDDELIDGCQ
ncbi:unnamed protein product [Rotaria sordida]|uniref:DDE Tnp4 domain-containing protein n=1 Tax=Rotaria sordida TaxID=392033 RepID=A0A819YJL2_9BILA|nr:unnamed protein product [Rotaria sordida]